MSSFVANVFILVTVWCYSGLGMLKQKQAFGADCDESNNIFDKCVYIELFQLVALMPEACVLNDEDGTLIHIYVLSVGATGAKLFF